MDSYGRRPGWPRNEKYWRPFSNPTFGDFGGILDPQADWSDDRVMKGVRVSFLLLIVLSGSLGEEERERGLKREEENGRRIGIENGRESSNLSGSTGGKGEKRESRNLLGSLLLKQATPYRRQPLRLPGVGTPRGSIHSNMRMWSLDAYRCHWLWLCWHVYIRMNIFI